MKRILFSLVLACLSLSCFQLQAIAYSILSDQGFHSYRSLSDVVPMSFPMTPFFFVPLPFLWQFVSPPGCLFSRVHFVNKAPQFILILFNFTVFLNIKCFYPIILCLFEFLPYLFRCAYRTNFTNEIIPIRVIAYL